MSDAAGVDEKQLCRDWLAQFPLLKRHQGGRKLLRIFDPVVFGIELRKLSTTRRPDYRPEFIAMNLLSQWHEFGVREEVYDHRNLQFNIEYSDHPEEFMKAVDSLRRGFPMLSAPEISEQTLIDMYRVEVRNRIEHNPNPLGVWSSLIQILKYYGRVEESAEEKRAMLAYARTLPTTALAYPPVTPEEYERRVETQIDAPLAVLLARRAEHLAKAGWDKLPGVVRSPRLDVYERETSERC